MQKSNPNNGTVEVGVAKVDITPNMPMRLSGYAARGTTTATEVLNKLFAKALVLGSDLQHPSVFITVDLLGLQWRIVSQVVDRLVKKAGLHRSQIAITASHTHGGPETGNLMNILQCRGDYPTQFHFSEAFLDLDQLIAIARYNEELIDKLEAVALAALGNREPAIVAWGQGRASFGANRITEGGPVDHALPVLRVTNLDGTLRAVLLNYATHGITYGPDINKFHGDWMTEAQNQIEAIYPGALAMVAIGCAGDSHPVRQGKTEYVKAYGQEIAYHVKELIESPLIALTTPPVGSMVWIKLPFAKVPTVSELIELAKTDTTIKGYYARLALERIQRGGEFPHELNYPIQTWAFDDKMVMVNMGNEVVVDYAILLKEKYGANRVWINTYANDVSCYIASRKLIKAGGYEADTSMYWYNMPAPFAEEVEEMVIDAVDGLMPDPFKSKLGN